MTVEVDTGSSWVSIGCSISRGGGSISRGSAGAIDSIVSVPGAAISVADSSSLIGASGDGIGGAVAASASNGSSGMKLGTSSKDDAWRGGGATGGATAVGTTAAGRGNGTTGGGGDDGAAARCGARASRSLTLAISVSGSNGLASDPSYPAFAARSWSKGSNAPVSSRTGTCE